MARRSNTVEETVEQAPTEETTIEQTEGTQPEAPEQKVEQVIDLDPFKEAVVSAMSEKDETTGEVPLANIEPVNVAYRALDGTKAKNAAKNWLDDSMKDALMGQGSYEESGPNLPDARAFVQIKENLSAAKSGGGEKAPADPKQAFVTRLASIKLAEQVAGLKVPEGVDPEVATNEAQELADSLFEQAQSYVEWQNAEVAEGEEKPEAPEVSPVVKSAIKLAAGKAAGGGTRASGGPRRNVGKHIEEAFAEVEEGTFLSVAAIAKFTSSEYGDDHPSQGAVQARLFPSSGNCTVEGVEPVDRTEDTPRGARKVA